jgi:hypothetical protein
VRPVRRADNLTAVDALVVLAVKLDIIQSFVDHLESTESMQ